MTKTLTSIIALCYRLGHKFFCVEILLCCCSFSATASSVCIHLQTRALAFWPEQILVTKPNESIEYESIYRVCLIGANSENGRLGRLGICV